jgi:hypothetical protein
LEKERKLVGQHPAATCVCAAQVDSIHYTRHDISQPFLSYRGAKLYFHFLFLFNRYGKETTTPRRSLSPGRSLFLCVI